MSELTLFDTNPTHIARSTDPETSRKAAERVAYRSGTHKARLLAEYRAVYPNGLTDDEAGDLVGLMGAWKRCADLRNDGMIEPFDVKMGRYGTEVRVCRATERGLE